MSSTTEFPANYLVPGFVPEEFDQGDRDICVSLAVTALLEYCRRDTGMKFSPQYLHARCRQEDPDTTSGTGIDTAFYCVGKYGVCEYSQWPTDRREDGVDAGELIDTLPAVEFPDFKYRMLLTPRNELEYKAFLSGANGNMPMPVVLGVEIFATGMTVNNSASWYHDPLPGDNSIQNHAVLVYGWRDTPGMDSRGYFIARNTFILEKGGCRKLHIPFEYLEKYAVSAGTVSVTASGTAVSSSDNTISEAEKENMTMDNRSSNAENNFFDTIRYNIDRGMYFYPDFRMSFFHSFTRQVNSRETLKSEKDISRFYLEFLADRDFASPVKAAVRLFTFQMDQKSKLLLAAAFFSPGANGGKVSVRDIDQLRNYVQMNFRDNSVMHIFMVLGSECGFDSSCGTATDPTVILCEYIRENIWSHRIPDFCAGELSRRFLVHIMPGKYANELAKIISLHDNISGNININYLKQQLVYSDQLDDVSVAYALDELFMKGNYAVDGNGNILACEDNPQLPPGFRIRSRYSRPTGVVRRMYYYWIIISLLLPVLVHTITFIRDIKLPWWITAAISLASLMVAKYSWQAKLRFQYNIK